MIQRWTLSTAYETKSSTDWYFRNTNLCRIYYHYFHIERPAPGLIANPMDFATTHGFFTPKPHYF